MLTSHFFRILGVS
jgi:hypothetical protein